MTCQDLESLEGSHVLIYLAILESKTSKMYNIVEELHSFISYRKKAFFPIFLNMYGCLPCINRYLRTVVLVFFEGFFFFFCNISFL